MFQGHRTTPRAAAVVNSLLRICNFYGLAPFIRHTIEHVDYVYLNVEYGRTCAQKWSAAIWPRITAVAAMVHYYGIVMLMVFWKAASVFHSVYCVVQNAAQYHMAARVSRGINCLALSVWDNCELASCHDYVCVSGEAGSIFNFRVLRVICSGGGGGKDF